MQNNMKSQKDSNYNFLEHGKMLGEIISRMSNNHTKWIFVLFSIIGFSLTLDKFILDIPGITKIIAWILVTIVIFIVQIIAIKVSTKYFELENAYRDKQKKIFKCEFNEYSMTPDISNTTRKKSWILTAGWIIIFIYLITQITIGLVYKLT